jgi:hypothetical protein
MVGLFKIEFQEILFVENIGCIHESLTVELRKYSGAQAGFLGLQAGNPQGFPQSARRPLV